MNKRIQSLYLAIGLTTKCNNKCFYCKKGGESISDSEDEIPLEELKKIIKVAYELGINSFRITGGEPTVVSYFGELLEFIIELGDDTRIRINTNGCNLMKYADFIELYKQRFDIVISVDSLSEYIKSIHYFKYLSPKIQEITRELVSRGISVRYNIVVTKLNFPEIKQLVIKATDDMNVKVKLLDLNKKDAYFFSVAKQISSQKLWNSLYLPMEELTGFLEEISDEYKPEYHQWIGYGIPMSAYFRNGHMIQIKDSSKGTNYSRVCRKECPYYKKCQEGVFSPFLSTNLVLHLSGCKNKNIHFNLKEQDEYFIKDSFNKILELFEDLEIQKEFLITSINVQKKFYRYLFSGEMPEVRENLASPFIL